MISLTSLPAVRPMFTGQFPVASPRFQPAPAMDRFIRATAVHPRFAGEVAEEVKRANLVAVQNVLPQEDIDAIVHYFRTRTEKSPYSHRDGNKIRMETSWLEGVVETKDGQAVQVKWNSSRGTEMTEAQKDILTRLMDAFIQNLHKHVETIPDAFHRVVATPMEYTFKAGYQAEKTLGWHRDSFIKYLGMLGIFKDPRIEGAQLELRSLDARDQVQSFDTIPNQLLMFHNIKAEHQVNGIKVADTDPDTPVYRNIITVGIRQPETGYDYVGALVGAMKKIYGKWMKPKQEPEAASPKT